MLHRIEVISILSTETLSESGIVIEGEVVPRRSFKKEELELRKVLKKMVESKKWSSVECKLSADLAKKLPPVSKMRLLYDDGVNQFSLLYFFNNEDQVVAFSNLPSLEDKSTVDEGCLELLLSLGKSWEELLRHFEEIEELHLAKKKEEDARKIRRKARKEENELRRSAT